MYVFLFFLLLYSLTKELLYQVSTSHDLVDGGSEGFLKLTRTLIHFYLSL